MTKIAIAFLLCSAAWAVEDAPAAYPATKTVDHTDDYHGTVVADPYRWLEDDVRVSPEVADWVTRQNEVTFSYLNEIPEREAIRKRLEELWNYEKRGAPFKKGGRYYYLKNDGLQNQSVVWVQESLKAAPEVLLNPNTWSADGTASLGAYAFSDDGKYVTYAINEAGSDWRTWRIMEIATRTVLDDELHWSKSGAAWTKDGTGIFYGRFAEPAEGEKYQALAYNMKVYYHRVGTPQSDDTLVYERPDHPEWGFEPEVTDDGRYLVLTAWIGTDDRYSLFVQDLNDPNAKPQHLIGDFDADYSCFGNDGETFYFRTTHSAPNGRAIAVDLKNPAPEHWREVIAERPEMLGILAHVGGHFTASYLKDARSQVVVYSKAGEVVREVQFPGLGTAKGFGGHADDSETFYEFASFAMPPSIYRYDVATGESTQLWQATVDMTPADYVTEQVFYESRDGTRVPMFITRKKETKLDGNNRCLLFGYGGFNIPSTPTFSVSKLLWIERGGIYALANLRGGGEYGEEWHKAGTKLQKQNVFDDFIAAAEWLIAKNYTKPELLTIQGRSNGGLLVGAAMTQRPELFGCALPAVGVMDMLRFQNFTAGRYWTDDYGSSDNPDEFKAIYAYSPYHNLKPGTCYPPTLVTTADTDDRVVPGHSFKFAARLQEMQACKNPTLIRIDTKAGHGGGKPTSKQIEEFADELAFAIHHTRPAE